MFKFAITMSLALSVTLLTLLTGACAGAKTQNSQANRSGQPTALLLQPTLKGQIERISLSISTARDAYKNNKLQEAVGQLQGANKEVDAALAQKLRLRDEFEALKSAIDSTIKVIERGDKAADSQLAELQVRIGAIKTNTP